MIRHLRMVAVGGLLGFVSLGLLLSGCGSSLENVVVQELASDSPRLPNISGDRLKKCFVDYGWQLAPGRHRFNPIVKVDRDGMKWGVTTPDIPATAADFAACTRIVLNDMAIPDGVLPLRSSERSAATTEVTEAQRSILGSPAVAVVVVVGLSEIVLEAGAYTILFAVTVKVVENAAEDVAELAKRGSWFTKCKAHYAACMATALGGPFGGNHHKSSRCNTCFQRCDFDKSWPTGVGNGTCEYWTPGW